MTRFLLALRCFFAVLLRRQLPPEAVALLLPAARLPLRREPDLSAEEPPVATRAGGQVRAGKRAAAAEEPVAPAAAPPAAAPAAALPAEPPRTAAPAAVPSPAAAPAALAPQPPVDATEQRRRGAVQVLAVLQREGRLLDFLSEDIDSYSDGQIGAAVRDIHRGCRKALAEHVKLAPIRPEPDEAVVRIAAGHDASQVRLIGQVSGRPPFEGTLRHHGWRSTQINLPDIPAGHDPTVICPAEVEIGG